jgi:hypothetical protein
VVRALIPVAQKPNARHPLEARLLDTIARTREVLVADAAPCPRPADSSDRPAWVFDALAAQGRQG